MSYYEEKTFPRFDSITFSHSWTIYVVLCAKSTDGGKFDVCCQFKSFELTKSLELFLILNVFLSINHKYKKHKFHHNVSTDFIFSCFAKDDRKIQEQRLSLLRRYSKFARGVGQKHIFQYLWK